MKKTLILLAVWMIGGMLCPSIYAAGSKKHKTITHSYKNARLKDVIDDVAKRSDYQIVYSADDLDVNKRISMNFKDASARAVLKKVLDKNIDIKAKRGVITLTPKPTPAEVFNRPALTPSREEEDSLRTIRYYEDTTLSVSCRTVTVERPAAPMPLPLPTRKGHYIQALVGLGYSSMGYSLKDGRNMGDVGGQLQLQYAYYFHENWGVTAGVGFSAYGSQSVLNTTKTWNDQGDSDGEQYNHNAIARDWKELQSMHTVDIPVGIQCQYPLPNTTSRLYAGIGMRLGVPVMSTYKLKSGSVEHTGYYPFSHATISNLPDRDFYTEQAADFAAEKQRLLLGKVAVGVMADLGVMIPATDQIDIMLGAYAQVVCNDMRDYSTELGWRQPSAAIEYRRHEFMPAYEGLIAASDYASAVRPWQVGVKVGISWHHKEKPKAIDPTYERIQQCDTTITLVLRADTIAKPQKAVAQQIQSLMKKSVIWFDLDKTVPKLQPADIIDRIAAILVANPNQRILVNGHASREGNERHNRRLSELRAKAVYDLLKRAGVRESQMTLQSFSADVDYSDSETAEHNISLDRRVEIIPED